MERKRTFLGWVGYLLVCGVLALAIVLGLLYLLAEGPVVIIGL